MARFLASDRNRDETPAATRRALDAISDAEPQPFWTESVEIPESNPTLVRDEHCDLCVVGGGYTGLWTAIAAKEREARADRLLAELQIADKAGAKPNRGVSPQSPSPSVKACMSHANQRYRRVKLGPIRSATRAGMT